VISKFVTCRPAKSKIAAAAVTLEKRADP